MLKSDLIDNAVYEVMNRAQKIGVYDMTILVVVGRDDIVRPNIPFVHLVKDEYIGGAVIVLVSQWKWPNPEYDESDPDSEPFEVFYNVVYEYTQPKFGKMANS